MNWPSKRIEKTEFNYEKNKFLITASHYIDIDNEKVKTVITCKKNGGVEAIDQREIEGHLLEGNGLIDEMNDFENYIKQEKTEKLLNS